MSEALDEQLSALVDDELDNAELPLLMRQLSGSDSLGGTLERYYLMRDAVRRELPVSGYSGLADRVRTAIEAEPAHTRSRRAWLPGQALRPAAGLAIAASAAVLAVSLWPTGPATPPQSDPLVTNTDNVSTLGSPSGAMRVSTGSSGSAATGADAPAATPGATNAGREWDRLDPQVQHLLNDYIVDHSEHAGSAQLGGVINYARIAGQEPKDQ